jgi:hypothetical protein
MPEVKQDVLQIMSLRARCKENKSLPLAGGLLDQPAWLMDLFAVIDGRAAIYKQRKAEEERREATRRELMNKTPGGRRSV